ncbi:Bacterial Ig-like domain (group 2) [Aquisphaera giovannonii]|uniref:Bacterial Ig-like domain (Group 2) n=1 Tax=Aquisphaera giovannonii TaxID=406548 RepID=A0A5B9VUV6_9BACT|nr:hypothetical protein [Aquisphaera giovannonii]QEH32062.1 Bacterial Ig-like domain (group 2) [Aquisphaera giovannonii]
MNDPLVRIGLSETACDFRPLALDPGLPMLDPEGATYRVLRRWLGDFAAEPVVRGGRVEFHAQREGRRPLGIELEPASAADLAGPLKDQHAALQQRLAAIRPATASERLILNQLRLPERHRDCFLFKYRTPGGPWQLVWLWGYVRKDEEPGTAVLCGRPECATLFVRRGSRPSRCPACAGAGGGERKRSNALPAAAALVVLAGLAASGYWFLTRKPAPPPVAVANVEAPPTAPALRLVVSPETWSGPVGARVAFQVRKSGPDGTSEDLGPAVLADVEDPRICRMDDATMRATALAPGKTAAHFRLGALETTVTLSVREPGAPRTLTIEPADPAINVGSTAALRLIGEYDDGSHADLTEAARWVAEPRQRLFCYGGWIEGLAAGEAEVAAEYRAGPSMVKPLRASRKVVVKDEPYRSLAVEIGPDPLRVATPVEVRVTATTGSGRRVPVSKSSALKLEVDPPQVAGIRDGRLVGQATGAGRLLARLDKLEAAREFRVAPGEPLPTSDGLPTHLRMAVGEVASLPGMRDVRGLESRAPGVVAVNGDRRLVAKAAGSATIVATLEPQAASAKPEDKATLAGPKVREVKVDVEAVELASLAIVPKRIALPVDEPVTARVVARGRDNREVELAPAVLAWEMLPASDAVGFDASRLEFRGREAASEATHPIAVRHRGLRATGEVEVVSSPFRLSVTPPGPIELPVGQSAPLQVWADRRGNRRSEIPADRVQWEAAPSPQFAIARGEVTARGPAGGTWEIRARYRGQASAPVLFRAAPAGTDEGRLVADRPVLMPGDSGRLRVERSGQPGTGPGSPDEARFVSSDPAVLAVEAKGGIYRAIKPGEATVRVAFPPPRGEISSPFRVIDPASARLAFEPERLTLGVGQVGNLALMVSAPGQAAVPLSDLGELHLTVESPSAVKLEGLRVLGLSPSGPLGVGASYRSLSARATVQVVKAGAVSPLRFEPARVTAPPGSSITPRLQEQVPGHPEQWRDVRPDAVTWKPNPAIVATPGTATAPGQLTIGKAARGDVEAVASYQGREARLPITVDEKANAHASSGARLELVREPAGLSIPVGGSQRYSLMIREGGQSRPASSPEWPADFEGEFVSWKAPVLTARKAGHRQRLTAGAEGKSMTFEAFTSGPPRPPEVAAVPPKEKPRSVRIAPGGKSPLRVTPGGRNGDFRVQATYGDGETRDVTDRSFVRSRAGRDSRSKGMNGSPPREGPSQPGAGVGSPAQAAPGDQASRGDGKGGPATVGARQGSGTGAARGDGKDGPATVGASQGSGTGAAGNGGRGIGPAGPAGRGTGPVAADRGVVRGLRPGKDVVDAEYRGVRSDQGLDVDVVEAPAIDAIRIEPDQVRLSVGESQPLRAIGLAGGQSVGEITDRAGLVWKSRSPRILAEDGPTVTATAEGRGGVTAQLGSIVSAPAEMEVLSRGSGSVGGLELRPAEMTLRVGESVQIGRDVLVFRGGRDVGGRCRVVAPHPDLLAPGPDGRTLTGRSPGSTTVDVMENGGHASLAVRVLASTDPSAGPAARAVDPKDTRLVIEPGEVSLLVGGVEDLRVYLVDEAGRWTDRTAGASLESSKPEVVRIVGARATARSSGQAVVTARLAGTQLTTEAAVAVADSRATELRVEPASLSMYAGERSRLRVRGRDEAGDRELADHPDLTFEVAGKDPGSVGVGPGGEVSAWSPGEAEVRVRWRAGSPVVVPVHVSAIDPSRIELSPAEGAVSRGDRMTFRVHAKQGDRDVELGPDQGVVLEVEDGSVARVESGLVVLGLSEGETNVVARRRGARAVARLSVLPPRAEGSTSPRPQSLRLEPESMRLAAGATGRSLKVLLVASDGHERDVTATARLELQPAAGVVSLRQDPSGIVVAPSKPGFARIRADVEGLSAPRPLDVEVVEAPADAARLRVMPSSLRLHPGEVAALDRVVLDSGPGLDLADVPYRLSIKAARVAAVEGGTRVRALAAGTAELEVEADGPPGRAGSLSARVPIAVEDSGAGEGEPAGLRLTGPTHTTVGAVVEFGVEEVLADASTRPVGHPGAALVVEEGRELVATRPGPALRAEAPGVASIRARYRGLISNSLRLDVQPRAASYRAIELEVDPHPLVVGEERQYRLWGDPADGGPRQDLTGLVGVAGGPEVRLEPAGADGEGPIAAARAGRVVGQKPGRARLRGGWVDGLASEGVPIEVVDAPAGTLGIEPASPSARVGETVTLSAVLRGVSGGRSPRPVEARWESLDGGRLDPGGEAGEFVARAAGRARVRARFGGQEAVANVEVAAEPFGEVRAGEISIDGDAFQVPLEVRAPRGGAGFEYRIVAEDGEATAWAPAEGREDSLTARLRSPKLKLRPGSTYQLVIEARAPATTTERYPYRFRLGLNVIRDPHSPH